MPNIRIRQLNGAYATHGFYLSDGNDHCCPRLLPGEIVEVPDNHFTLTTPRFADLITLTQEAPTRLLRYATILDAKSRHGGRDDHAANLSSVATSLAKTAKGREENRKNPEILPIPDYVPEDDGLPVPVANNAITRPAATPPPALNRNG